MKKTYTITYTKGLASRQPNVQITVEGTLQQAKRFVRWYASIKHLVYQTAVIQEVISKKGIKIAAIG